ncbi:nucleoside-diphosphate sugar epimerase [Lutibacter sp.]|uniref:nucleoside-diphosphate sugar epimerase n=1 Tax=Lutibacter sp. TaxID=1925666 RepID=UPI0035636450
MGKTAIILGATGLTGNLLLQKLIDDTRYDSIKLFSRKKIEGLPSKVQQFIGNIIELENFKEDFTADEVFCCIGTTLKNSPDKNVYRSIDYGIPTKAAQLSKENNIEMFMVISALGANPNSALFYNKLKGEMEQKVLSFNIKNTFILQPSYIKGDRNENRPLERIYDVLFPLISVFLVGKLKKYKTIKATAIADAMYNLAELKPNIKKIESDQIKNYAITKN